MADLLLEQLAQSPKLALYQQKIAHILELEQARRQRFYDEVTEHEKAEFINGEIIVHSPVKLEHNATSGNLYILLKAYTQKHRLGFVGLEKILISLTRNDYEPDVCYFGAEKADTFRRGQMRFPAPDLIAEVLSPSTEHIDRGIKFTDYAAHGVQEYWLIDPEGEVVEQYRLSDGAYELLIKAASGEISSVAVEGFTIPIRALFDEALNLATLQQILAG